MAGNTHLLQSLKKSKTKQVFTDLFLKKFSNTKRSFPISKKYVHLGN